MVIVITLSVCIFDLLLGHTKIQIKFEFGFDPLIFHEVMALGLREIQNSEVNNFLNLWAITS